MLSFLRHHPGLSPAVESLLTEAAQGVAIPSHGQEEIKASVIRRIGIPDALRRAVEARPTRKMQERVKARLLAQIAVPSRLWDRVLVSLTPAAEIQNLLRAHVLSRLHPSHQLAFFPRMLRWTAAFTLVLLAVRISPFLFLASPSLAESSVLFIPTQGEVSILMNGLWQPVRGEVKLEQSAQVRTEQGFATLILHDDGVLRLASNTTITLHDLADRPEYPTTAATITLEKGTLWVQALIPVAVGPGWQVRTALGDVRINEGSVSMSLEGQQWRVTAWDRQANVEAAGKSVTFVAGEEMRVGANGSSAVRRVTDAETEDVWVMENLRRDAVHRHEIALLQQERRAQGAGILPTSTLYPVKRVAEAVDMLFTFGQEARQQKLLQQASTRLNEAAALLITGSGTRVAERPLEEYKQTLLAVATGSGQNATTQSLVQQQLLTEVAETAAALPDDGSYLLKKTVLETSAAVPGSMVKPGEVRETVAMDTLASLSRRVQEGKTIGVVAEFKDLLPSLPAPDASREARKRAKVALAFFAQTVREEEKTGTGRTIAQELAPYLPQQEAPRPAVRPLSDAEVEVLVQQIYDRVFSYKMPRSRYNQLLVEFQHLDGHPDQGRILRQLHYVLPENGLAKYVRTEFQKVREKVQGKNK